MRKGGVRLLEPIMKVEVVTPEEHMGDVIGDLTARRGVVQDFIDKPGSLRLIRSFVPLAEMFSYISNLRGALLLTAVCKAKSSTCLLDSAAAHAALPYKLTKKSLTHLKPLCVHVLS